MLMKQKKMLALTLSQLGLLYRQELPDLAALADACCDGAEFRMRLGSSWTGMPLRRAKLRSRFDC